MGVRALTGKGALCLFEGVHLWSLRGLAMSTHNKMHEELRDIETQTICASGQRMLLRTCPKKLLFFWPRKESRFTDLSPKMTALLGTLCDSSKTIMKDTVSQRLNSHVSMLPSILTGNIFQFREKNLCIPVFLTVLSRRSSEVVTPSSRVTIQVSVCFLQSQSWQNKGSQDYMGRVQVMDKKHSSPSPQFWMLHLN